MRVETDDAVLWLAVADVNHHSTQPRRLWSRSARSLPQTTRRYEAHYCDFVFLRYFRGMCFLCVLYFCISYFAGILCSKATVRAHLSLMCLVQLPGLLCYRIIVLLLPY